MLFRGSGTVFPFRHTLDAFEADKQHRQKREADPLGRGQAGDNPTDPVAPEELDEESPNRIQEKIEKDGFPLPVMPLFKSQDGKKETQIAKAA